MKIPITSHLTSGHQATLTPTLMGGGGENPLQYFEDIEKRRCCAPPFLHTLSAILFASFLIILSLGHLRSGQVALSPKKFVMLQNRRYSFGVWRLSMKVMKRNMKLSGYNETITNHKNFFWIFILFRRPKVRSIFWHPHYHLGIVRKPNCIRFLSFYNELSFSAIVDDPGANFGRWLWSRSSGVNRDQTGFCW